VCCAPALSICRTGRKTEMRQTVKRLKSLNRDLARALDEEANCSGTRPDDAAFHPDIGKAEAGEGVEAGAGEELGDGEQAGAEHQGDTITTKQMKEMKELEAVEAVLAKLGTNVSHASACLRSARNEYRPVRWPASAVCKWQGSLSLSRARERKLSFCAPAWCNVREACCLVVCVCLGGVNMS
jgi:hypothetical protein